jgi:hypothetical protein
MRHIATSLITIGLLLQFVSLSAQESQPLESGVLVRVTAPTRGINIRVAKFSAIEDDELVVMTYTTHRYPLSSIARLELHAGTKSAWLSGAKTGGVIGGLSLLTAAFMFCGSMVDVSPFGKSGGDCESYGAVGLIGLMGAAGGALVGSGIGLLLKTDRWEEVPLDRLRVSYAPQRKGRMALRLTVRF